MTRWAAEVDPVNVWPEYPRPQMVRGAWQSLNGLWNYAITGSEATQPTTFEGQILVPFPVESALSGVKTRVDSTDQLWYHRTFEVPEAWAGQRVLLHFEAVDWETRVWVNGNPVGDHRGGYDPFTFDITDLLRDGSQDLVVAVSDPTDAGTQPLGKQTRNPGGIFYTPVTGIWQSVWLEAVPTTYIDAFKTYPNIEKEQLEIRMTVEGAYKDEIEIRAVAFAEGEEVASVQGSPNAPIVLDIDNPKLWTPDAPFLYDLELHLMKDGIVIDTVQSYFGMRSIGLGKDEKGFTRILLNNEVTFQNGPLDQGFWPDGIYTPPTDEALRYDIEVTKSLGFNMLRKHVKVEPRRFYYWCDKLGILVWQDMPNGDEKIGPNDPDIQRDPASAAQFEFELKALVETHFNHPSIVMWVPFNEGWGQYETERIVDWVKELDPTRLVNNASGWTDRGVGDVHDLHSYPHPAAPEPEDQRAGVLGEFGGLALRIDDHVWEEENWGYSTMRSAAELMKQYETYYTQVWKLSEEKGLSAAVYTQITDVETENNGLLTYDRAVIKVDEEALYDINTNQYIPAPDVTPFGGLFNSGESVQLSTMKAGVIRYTLDGTTPTAASALYDAPLVLYEDAVLNAKVFAADRESRTVTANFEQTDFVRPAYTHRYSLRYTAGGDFALIDGKQGTLDFRDGAWQGFAGDDLEVILDLKTPRRVSSITTRFLEDTNVWIFLPTSVEIAVSADGKTYETVLSTTQPVATSHQAAHIEPFEANGVEQTIRYVKIRAKNVGLCPPWHEGTGKAWLFVDEIEIQ